MSKNIVFEGWLTKSPPTKRIWRAKWRRRWFALRQSGELPGQYFLDYYADRNCRRLKGTINLDLCEQVDAGLRMERGQGSLDNKIRGSVFTIRTQSRTYHLEAECEADMVQWVDAICRVCGLRSTEDNTDVIGTYQNNPSRLDCTDGGVYIPISECITGVRVQDMKTYTFLPKHTMGSKRFERPPTRAQTTDLGLNNGSTDNWDNESTISIEDCVSLDAGQSNIVNWSVAKSFTKLAVSPTRNGSSVTTTATVEAPPVAQFIGPPVPPRPPKTFQGPRMQEPVDSNNDNVVPQPTQVSPLLRVPQRSAQGSPPAPARSLAPHNTQSRYTDDEDEAAAQPSMLYCNMSSMPPAVDRARKPRYGVHSHSIAQIHNLLNSRGSPGRTEGDVLQYLDLDLPAPKPKSSQDGLEIVHGKSLSESRSDYRTVDFLKTEAFNITRQDAEASRNLEY